MPSVTKAKQQIGYGPYNGKHLSIELVEPDRDFYFSDEKIKFRIKVENIGIERFTDKIAWYYAFLNLTNRTYEISSVDLEPQKEEIYEMDRLLGFPGVGAICVLIPPELPFKNEHLKGQNYHTLYAFTIFDRAVWRRDKRDKNIIIIASIIAAISATIAAIATYSDLLSKFFDLFR